METAHRQLERIAERSYVQYLHLRAARHPKRKQLGAVGRVAKPVAGDFGHLTFLQLVERHI